MTQAAATDPSPPAPASLPSVSEDATKAAATTTAQPACPVQQQQQQHHHHYHHHHHHQDQQRLDPDEATPPTDQEVHEIAAHVAAAAKDPTATSQAASAAALLHSVGKSNDNGQVSSRDETLILNDDEEAEATSYWDAKAMAPLNAVSAPAMYLCSNRMLMRSKAAISRLRRYVPPPFPLWDRLPVSRRAAVLILLYADRRGDLRVVITMRAASLRSFSGHAAFPGGKADSSQETPYEIARREAWEEIGLPVDDARLPKPFKIEPLCYLPYNLARTELVVRPCVAFLHADEEPDEDPSPLVEERMIPRLDAKEVAAVFSAPFQNFLRASDMDDNQSKKPPPGHWYDGTWIQWKDHPWRVHNFYVPVDNQRVTTPRNSLMDADHPQGNLAGRLGEEAAAAESEEGGGGGAGRRFKVWGLTAHMLVDAARIAYGRDPEFECNPHLGDEEIILQAEREGSLVDKKRKRDEGATGVAAAVAGDGEEDRDEGRGEPAKM